MGETERKNCDAESSSNDQDVCRVEETEATTSTRLEEDVTAFDLMDLVRLRASRRAEDAVNEDDSCRNKENKPDGDGQDVVPSVHEDICTVEEPEAPTELEEDVTTFDLMEVVRFRASARAKEDAVKNADAHSEPKNEAESVGDAPRTCPSNEGALLAQKLAQVDAKAMTLRSSGATANPHLQVPEKNNKASTLVSEAAARYAITETECSLVDDNNQRLQNQDLAQSQLNHALRIASAVPRNAANQRPPGAYPLGPGSMNSTDNLAASTSFSGQGPNRLTEERGQAPLAEALPVEELGGSAPFAECEAEHVDPDDELWRQRYEQERKRRDHGVAACVTVTVIACVVLALVLGLTLDPKQDVNKTGKSDAPSNAPSASPTGLLDLFLLDLPSYTLESLKNSSTPQWKALQWLDNHPDLMGMQEWRKRQLFALVTFYYSMAGPLWRDVLQEEWLLYERSECYWYSSEFGQFFDGTEYVQDDQPRYNMTPCNEKEEFQVLYLADLDISGNLDTEHGLQLRLPPELSLLTSLSILALPVNGINATLEDFIPSQLYQMTNLTVFDVYINGLEGKIPSAITKLTNLQALVLYGNRISGELPSQLGLLTNLMELAVDLNNINGTIPTELAKLTKLKLLALENTLISGSLPQELANLTTLEDVVLVNTALTGTIPEDICSVNWGLIFDCHSNLCGCCWCPCSNDTGLANCSHPTITHPSEFNVEWPGAFPAPRNTTNVIVINIQTDEYPEDSTMEWSLLDLDVGGWKILDSTLPDMDATSLHSYTKEVESEALYKLTIYDFYEDGVCCSYGFGWFTVTSAIPSLDYVNGTVVWEAKGDVLGSSVDVLVWIDSNGIAHKLEYVPDQGLGYAAAEGFVMPLSAEMANITFS